jgi:cohesin domain-containing protein
VIAALVLGVDACGGAGGGGGRSPTDPGPGPTPTATPSPTPNPSPTPTPTPGGSITFTAASAGPGIVLAQGAGTTSSSLTVDVRAASVTGLYGIAFDLDYPTAIVHGQSATLGTFLGTSSQVSMQITETTPGHVVIGISRLGTLPGVNGSGIIASFVFTPVANGTGPFTISRNTAFASNGSAISVPWAAGTVTVSR